ncbi:DUF6427 family protein [Pseudotenacibaculum haliotis]|uniref:DUF6427 family protein n=1 Tax=Pseudotenacibaculum haliotis TaxID=1862138 RepID=A0ABW5LPM0_9FLAO
MLANFFGKSNPANFIIILVLFLGFFFASFFIDHLETKSPQWIASVIGLFLLLFFFFNFILAKNKLTLYNSYGFLFFVLLFSTFPFTQFDREALILNIVLLILLRRIYSLRTPKATIKKMFDSGFWLSILFVLEPFTMVYGVLLFASILLFQKLNFRTFLIPIVGFLAPLLIYFAYCFWYDDTDKFLNLFSWYTDYNFGFYQSNHVLIPLIFIGSMTVISILFKTPKVFMVSGNYRKFWTLTIINLLVAVGLIIITNNRTGNELIYAFFPTAVILANGIEGVSKKIFQNLILILFVLIPILVLII